MSTTAAPGATTPSELPPATRSDPAPVPGGDRDDRSPRSWSRPVVSGAALGVVVMAAAALAVALHRNGHAQGDDFALYLRQARSVFDGDMAQVVADNRFSVINSGGRFSPYAYPWGVPLLLSPFVKLWGLDYDRLKLVEVAVFCVWLVLVHGIVRRRAGRAVAFAVTAVVATAPVLLIHTDALLSEFPHAAAVGVFIWWLDRIGSRHRLIGARTRDLVLLGVLVTVAYNMRREAIVLVGVVVGVQAVEVARSAFGRLRTGSDVTAGAGPALRSLAVPHVAFVASAAGFQLLLPSMLFPDAGDSVANVVDRLGEYPRELSEHLGIGAHPAIGVAVLVLAGIGAVVGVRRRPRLDGPLLLVTVLSTLAVSTHFRMVDRYYFQVLPWVLYFGAAGAIAIGQALTGGRGRRWVPLVGVVPLLYLVAVHTAVLPERVGAARDFDRAGSQHVGPTHPDIAPVFEAVVAHTEPDAVVAFYRARTMTLLTDRRAIQTTNLDRVQQRADYYAQRRGSTYSQPELRFQEALRRGFDSVWADDHWILWRLRPPAADG